MPAVLTGPQEPPKYSLLWDIIDWVDQYIMDPRGEGSFTFTGEQIRFLQHFWAVDERGRWLYPRACLERCKGWGKDPIGTVIALVELCGPARVHHIDFETGYVHGQPDPSPWVVVAATAESQTENTMSMIPALVNDECIETYGLDIGKTVVYAKKQRGRGRIQAITSNARVVEGKRITFCLRNETHHWITTNGGHDMARVLNDNVIKMSKQGSHMLDITNAPMPGEDSVHERVLEEWGKAVAGKLRSKPILLDSREADPNTDVTDYDSLYRGLSEAAGDAHWLDIEGTIENFWSPSTGTEASKRRFFLNQKVAASDAWVQEVHMWDALARQETIMPGEEITLGFDGSRANDATALVACRVSDGFIQPLEIWQPQGEDWEVPRDAVDGRVRHAFSNYRVRAFFADVNEWESYIEQWSDDFRSEVKIKASPTSSIGWDMRKRAEQQTREYEAMRASIMDGSLIHNGDPILRQHVLNARNKYNEYGVIPRKESRESSRKIDALAATMLARMARGQLLESGKATRRRGKAIFL